MMKIASMKKAISWLIGGGLFATALLLATPSGLATNLRHISPNAVVLVLLLTGANIFVVAFRFWRLLSQCGIGLTWSTALRACLAGNLASLAFIPLLAQIAGRQAVLRKYGLSAVATASVSAYERLLLAAISASAAAIAGVYLVGESTVSELTNRLALAQILIALITASVITYALGHLSIESKLIRMFLRRRNVRGIFETLLITLVGQGLMMAAFATAFNWADSTLSWQQLVASAAIVSFAASIPLSVGGWGIREIMSVYILGQLGVDAGNAMAASVMVGICSTLVILLTSPVSFALSDKKEPRTYSRDQGMQSLRVDDISAWLLGMGVATLVFFQVHVPLQGTIVNVNLGDPLAVLALAAVSLTLLQVRSSPHWRISGLNAWLGIFSASLLIAFAVGVYRFGVTPWAMGNKLMGWLILMGYLSAGYILATQHRRLGVKRLVEAALAMTFTIVWLKITIRLTPWFPGQALLEAVNFEGFSNNRNALAFQLCGVLALALGYLSLYAKILRNQYGTYFAVMMAVATIFLGIALSGSRAGMVVTIILVTLSLTFYKRLRIMLAATIVLAVALWLGAMTVSGNSEQVVGNSERAIQSSLSTQASNIARWKANVIGVEMWLDSPFFGTGLGSFVQQSEVQFGSLMTIHSTPIWLLAEFGLMGLVTMGFGLFIAIRHLNRMRRSRLDSQDKAWLLLFVCFAVFCQFHEMLYQRILWLFMGALLAMPTSMKSRSTYSTE